jgi:hypothetical protein
MEQSGAGISLADGAVTAYTAFRHALPRGAGARAGADKRAKKGLLPGV